MRTRSLLLVVAAVLAFPTAAGAKGPSEATISGPGLDPPLAISGTEGSGDLGLLVSGTGFFPAAFDQSPDPMLRKRPAVRLGPRYEIVYRVPGPHSVADRLRQDLYPYAAGGPLSYMRPGQPFWEQRTRGGWYRGTAELRRMLVRAGLPAKAPTAGSAGRSTGVAAAAAIGAALAGFAVFASIRRRR
jgi:hypothetical protein